MPSLKIQIGWCNRAQLALLGAVAMAGALFYVGGWRPHESSLRELNAKINQTQHDLAESQRQARLLPAIAADVNRLREQVKGLKKLPLRPDLGEFDIRTSQLFRQDHLRVLSSNWASTPMRQADFYELPVSFKFAGDFQDVFAFLSQVEEMPRLTRIQSIKVEHLDAAGQVQVELTMNLYYAEG